MTGAPTKYYVDAPGNYLGGFGGYMDGPEAVIAAPPAGAIEVPTAPADARQVWNGSSWGAAP